MDMRGKSVDLVGNKYGKWVVLSKVPKTVNDIGKPQKWLCQCECGNKKELTTHNLIHGCSRSCGCARNEYSLEKRKKTNKYLICGDKTIIYTFDGKELIIDTEDLEKVLKICWIMDKNGYGCGKDIQTHKMISMHRYILNVTGRDVVVDHINRNPSDNRKCNLRTCTPQENSWNQGACVANTCGVSGVIYHKRRQKWRVTLKCKGKNMYFGYYDNVEDAIKVRIEAEKKYYGDFAPIHSHVEVKEHV